MSPKLFVVFLFLASAPSFATQIRCDVSDPLRPQAWPSSYLEINTNSNAITSADIVDFVPGENGKFEKFVEPIFSISNHLRGGHRILDCLDENTAQHEYGRLFSFCNRLEGGIYDRLAQNLEYSKSSPGQLSIEVWPINSNDSVRRFWPLKACK